MTILQAALHRAGFHVDWILRICGSCGLLAALAILWRTRAAIRHTTLTAAWAWSMIAVTAWAAAWLAGELLSALPQGAADRLWYAAAILMLCPPLAVLGSRRPTTRVWQWFVVLPMIVVLGLPLGTSWQQSHKLALETPVLAGFGLVLAMSAGNYVGTRFTLSAVLFMLALALLAASVSSALSDDAARDYRLRPWGTIALSAAVIAAGSCGRRRMEDGEWRMEKAKSPSSILDPPSSSSREHRLAGADRVWNDFRNAFGIVWARRIQDRVNAVAVNEQWPARLEADGFAWRSDRGPDADAAPSRAEVEAAAERIEHTLRWLLRRFCDPPWLDERLEG